MVGETSLVNIFATPSPPPDPTVMGASVADRHKHQPVFKTKYYHYHVPCKLWGFMFRVLREYNVRHSIELHFNKPGSTFPIIRTLKKVHPPCWITTLQIWIVFPLLPLLSQIQRVNFNVVSRGRFLRNIWPSKSSREAVMWKGQD